MKFLTQQVHIVWGRGADKIRFSTQHGQGGVFETFSHLRLMSWSTQTQNTKLVSYDISAKRMRGGKILIRCLGLTHNSKDKDSTLSA